MSLTMSRRARSLVAASIAAVTLGAGASHASAHGISTWQINDYKHHAADTQEEGRFGARSDEFYLLKVNFKVQIGVRGSAATWGNDPYEIDDIDKGEDHSIAAKMGDSRFTLDRAWDPTYLAPQILGGKNQGPWVYGEFVQAYESDSSPWSSVHDVQHAANAAVLAALKHLEVATPDAVAANALAQALIDPFVPSNRALRSDVLSTYLKGVALDSAIAAIKHLSWKAFGDIFDDRIGAPHMSVYVGLENYAPFGFSFPMASWFNSWAAGAKSSMGLADDDVIAALPTGGREYTQRYAGDGATYDISVHAGKVS